MGKGEIACYEQFLLFPQCFQKSCFPGASKGIIVWEWVNTWPLFQHWFSFTKALEVGWLIVLGFNTTLTAKVISWQSVTLTHVSWLSHSSTNATFLSKATITFLTCFCRGEKLWGENMPERKLAATRDWTHNHQSFENTVGKGEIAQNEQFLHFPQCFPAVWRT